MTLDPLQPLPLLTAALPGIGGRIKTQPEDFEVEEIPAYAPSGEGDFLYLWLEKRSLGAEFFVRQIGRRLGIGSDEIGTAGLKDRHAVTRQMVSVPKNCESQLAQLEGDGIRVLATHRHSNKLKPGHLRGNRFRILVRNPVPDAETRLPGLLVMLQESGVPNFYGNQRFGRDGETFTLGMSLLTLAHKGRIRPFLRRLALSSVQSALFNRHIARRMADGLLRRAVLGDVMAKWPFGGMFTSKDAVTEQERFDKREIIHTGPMFGKKMLSCAEEGLKREEETLAEAGLRLEQFHGFGKLLNGTRRFSLVYVEDLQAQIEAEGVRLMFTLPAGSYATVLLREVTHGDEMGTEDAD
jgi:tRNA pseudouridine13 synthase